MRPKTTLLLLVAATTAVAGCTLNRAGLRKTGESLLGQIGGNTQVIEPKRCLLTVAILPRPMGDAVVNGSIWNVADEQVVPSDDRRSLEANGIRIGLLTGGLPADVEAALNAPPPKKVDPSEFNLPDGSPTLVTLAETAPTASIFLNRDGRPQGKDYQDASGWFRITATHDGPTGVALRFVPEIHHGPVLRRYDAVQGAGVGPLNTMQFGIKDGQQEDTLRELAASLTLQPGQVAVIGCDPERKGSLGAFLFTQAEPNSDRLLQKVLLVRATRTNVGIPGSSPEGRPKLVPEEPPDELPIPARKPADAAAPPADNPKPGPTSPSDPASALAPTSTPVPAPPGSPTPPTIGSDPPKDDHAVTRAGGLR